MTIPTDHPLLKAAAAGDESAVAAALAQGMDVNARGEFGDTALNVAAEHGHLAVVRNLLDAGAAVENRGGADKTPIMNAASGGHVDVVKLLLERGAQVSDDLLASVHLKVNILEENAADGMVKPEAVKAWRWFLDLLFTARLRQDLPEIVGGLAAADAEERRQALQRIETAANRGIDISSAVVPLQVLASDPDAEVRGWAGAALAAHYALHHNWNSLRDLLAAGAAEVKTAALPAVASAAQDGADVSPLVPAMLALLGEGALNLRQDAAVVLGFAATHGLDVSGAVPHLTRLLSDAAPEARKVAAWALYRIAKHGATAGAVLASAVPALRALLVDDDEGVRDMAAEALRLAE